MYYVLEGKKVRAVADVSEWVKMSGTTNRWVARTKLPNGFDVSTVFLGIDHGFGPEGPLLFETMVFESEDGGGDIDYERCSTYEQAEEQHKRMVEKWTKTE